MDEARLEHLLEGFPNVKLLVIGDYFLDKYFDLDQRLGETSLETGLEAYQATGVRCSPGAAGTVVNNLRALDVQVMAMGVIGDDGHGYELKTELVARDVDIEPLIVYRDRFTPTYVKPMLREPDGRIHELNRIDIKNRGPLPQSIQTRLVEQLGELAPGVNGIVIADQVPEANCGVITDQVRSALSDIACRHPHLTIAADSRERIGLFENIILKPNAREAMLAVGAQPSEAPRPEQIEAAGASLFRRTGRPVFITVGAQGILVFAGQGAQRVPGIPVSGPLDIVGAGDSVMAGIVASLCAGATPAEAAWVGNLVASITVQQIGTTGTASRPQVLERFRESAQVTSTWPLAQPRP
jgi:rfaE bifunctional protein kinase chain/domain